MPHQIANHTASLLLAASWLAGYGGGWGGYRVGGWEGWIQSKRLGRDGYREGYCLRGWGGVDTRVGDLEVLDTRREARVG